MKFLPVTSLTVAISELMSASLRFSVTAETAGNVTANSMIAAAKRLKRRMDAIFS